MNHDDHDDAVYQDGYRDGTDSRNHVLAVQLNRLRHKVAPSGLDRDRAAYLSALDDVASALGLRKQTKTTYVV